MSVAERDFIRIPLEEAEVSRVLADPDYWPEQYNAMKRDRDRLVTAILDIDAHATPLGEDEDGFVAGGYAISVGSLHRALGLIGHTAAREREHGVCIEAEHGPACDGCETLKHIVLESIRKGLADDC